MRLRQQAKLVRIHCSEGDRVDGKPLYEAIVAKCRELGIAGATVLSGLEGYGETAAIHRSGLLRADRPVVVLVVDMEESVNRLIEAVEPLLHTGVIATSSVEAVRFEREK